MMSQERKATLWRGGFEADAKLHVSVEDANTEIATPPGCAGHQAQMLVVGSTYVGTWIDTADKFTGEIRDLVIGLWNHLAVRQLLEQVPPAQKARLCQRCVGRYLTPTQGEPE